MPIYTGTGDDGQTGLFGNRRVPKDDVRITAYGTVDELNSILGLIGADLDATKEISSSDSAPTRSQVKSIQDALFEVGADLATEGGKASVPRVEKAVVELEAWIDASEEQLPQLKTFVLPGGGKIAALLHVARTVTRRAERCYWTLSREVADTHPVPEVIGVYLNRLSDLCFSWARLANKEAGIDDVPWTR
jgi:cob(I)alamin adenosyltransferase